MRIANLSAWAMAGIISLSGSLAMAGEDPVRPVDKGINFQRPVTEVARDIQWMDDFLLIIITVITVFVTALLLIVIFRFNRKANPKPATFTHNATLEVVWTAIPVLILVIIAIPSLRLLFLQLDVPEPDLTIKATGNQWYWSYEYPDAGVEFDSVIVAGGFSTWEDVMADEAAKAEIEQYGVTRKDWLFATDTNLVVPVNAVVNVKVTSSDVLHGWYVPAFGSKIDAVPGRLNETWFRADETGIFYGQCSELCGLNHAYMPINVEVVTQDEFDAWVKTQQAANGTAEPNKLATSE
jgi:cytochrome c oxidase subunit II